MIEEKCWAREGEMPKKGIIIVANSNSTDSAGGMQQGGQRDRPVTGRSQDTRGGINIDSG